MNNLFSIFDPASVGGLSLNWISALLFICVLPPVFWASKPLRILGARTLFRGLGREFSATLAPLSYPGAVGLILALFIFVLINNSLGLLPYVFTARSHLTFTIGVAIPIWLGPVVKSWALNTKAALAHLVPLGAPMALGPFIVLIEISRNLIRPVALAVRLAANMVAGHLLLSLLRGMAPARSGWLIALCLLALLLLLSLEIAVAAIQAYVIRVLSTIYVADVNSPKLF